MSTSGHKYVTGGVSPNRGGRGLKRSTYYKKNEDLFNQEKRYMTRATQIGVEYILKQETIAQHCRQ